MNDDLISRKSVLDAFDCSIGGVPFDSVQYVIEYADKMMSRISALSSAQPEIIYCGECKYMMPNGRCSAFADPSIRPSASDYCSCAERRQDEVNSRNKRS